MTANGVLTDRSTVAELRLQGRLLRMVLLVMVLLLLLLLLMVRFDGFPERGGHVCGQQPLIVQRRAEHQRFGRSQFDGGRGSGGGGGGRVHRRRRGT